MSNIDDILKDEINKLKQNLDNEVNDPAHKVAIAQIINDLAMIPIRLSRGEDVTHITNSLKAEAALRGVTFTLKAQALAQQAWMNTIFRIMGAALVAAI